MPGGNVTAGILASCMWRNVLWLPFDTTFDDTSLMRSAGAVRLNASSVSVALVTNNVVNPGETAAYFNRNCLYYTPRTGVSSFVLPGNFCVHGFACSDQTNTNWCPLVSVGHVSHGGILIRPGSTIGGVDDVYVNGNMVYSGLITLFPRGVWTYFALSRRAGRLRLHTAKRDGGGAWVITEHPLIAGTEMNNGIINPSNRGVYVGASYHKEDQGIADERFLGWAPGTAGNCGGARAAWTASALTAVHPCQRLRSPFRHSHSRWFFVAVRRCIFSINPSSNGELLSKKKKGS